MGLGLNMNLWLDPSPFGSGGATEYRYIRLFFPDGNAGGGDGGRLGLREVELRATQGGADLTDGADATQRQDASFSSTTLNFLYDDNYGFDNNIATGTAAGWATSDFAVDDSFIGWDFNVYPGTPQVVQEVRAYSAWNAVASSPARIVVQGSNDFSNWDEIFDSGPVVFGAEQWLKINAIGAVFE